MKNLNILTNESSSKYLTIEEIRDRKPELYGTISGDLATEYSGYIGDAISDAADNAVDIYNEDLEQYYYDHETECTEALQEFCYSLENFPSLTEAILQAARVGEFLTYEQEAYDELENICIVHAINYIVENKLEITEEQLDEILERVADEIDSDSTFKDIDSIVDEVADNELDVAE